MSHGSEKIDIAAASPHTILNIRKKTLGYVRAIPRVSALDIVTTACRDQFESLALAQKVCLSG